MSGSSIERLLDKIDADISDFLIFVGVLDNNAKLISFRRGKASFSLPIERHDIFLFGTSDLHIFVITSPTSEGQVAKALADLVATLDAEPHVAASTLAGRSKEQTMTAAMASVRHDEPVERQTISPKSKPEVITMLQGYLMALEPGCTIQDDAGGFYKIRAGDGGMFTWSTLEKLSSTFRDRLDMHHVGLDTDGKVFVRISLK